MPATLGAPATLQTFDSFDVKDLRIEFLPTGGALFRVHYATFLAGSQVGNGEVTPPFTEVQWAALTGAGARLKALGAIATFLGVSAIATIT